MSEGGRAGPAVGDGGRCYAIMCRRDGFGGVAEMEGAQAQQEEEPAMAPEAREWLLSQLHSVCHIMDTEGTRKEKTHISHHHPSHSP